MTFTGPMSDIVDNTHSLLEPPSPAYSNVTVRRAFIVWMYCGQRNKFKDVCNYFHYLEALEDQLSPERRANSRHHEFTLFSKQPPTSEYLIDNFPQLYKESCIKRNCASKVEEIRNENSVFKLEGFNEIAPKKGTSTQEIVEASRMIREYCRIQMISLKKFLEEFKQHASKCGLSYTVTNVASYIKRKMLQAEIELEANYTKTLGFLIGNSAENIINGLQVNTVSNNGVGDVKTKSFFKEAEIDKNFKPKILRKDDAKAIEGTKNIWNTKTNTEFNNTSGFGEIKTEKDNVFDNEKYLKDRTFLDDLTDDNIELKKERRFSGSYLMKMELEKFRKI